MQRYSFEQIGYHISGMAHDAIAFKPVTIVISTPDNLLVEISGALGVKESHFISKDIF